jgi:hypothetical protein
MIEELNTNPSILNNIRGEISILQNNKIDYVAPENIYINSNLEPNYNLTHKYKFIKKNANDKIIRVEFSSSSDIVKYRIYNDKIDRLITNSSLIVYENLGKKNIDIKLNDTYESFIFEVYHDNIVDNKNNLSYTLRYRTDGGKEKFNNYKTIAETKGELKKIKDQNDSKFRNVEISIPTIQNLLTLQKVNSIYYLKVYKYDEKDLMISNTISIVDGIEPNKTYEFKFDGENYNKSIQIPLENLYYISLTTITPDKELLAYKSFLIDKDNTDYKDDKNNGWIIFIVIICVILFVVILVLSIHFIKRKRSIKANELLIMKNGNMDINLQESD